MSTATKTQAHIVDLTAEEYHLHIGNVSNSMVKDFQKSPRKFEGRYITETLEGKTTKEMDIGTVGHAAILEPHIIDGVCLEIPASVLNGQGHRMGKAWTEFKAEHTDRILMTEVELAKIRAMHSAVYSNELARKLLSDPAGKTEASIFWTCPLTGMPRKCRPDFLGSQFIVDVKTTAELSPQGFAKTAARFKYHQQNAFYSDGVEALTGIRLPFMFIVVPTEPPFRCHLYQLDERALLHARSTLDNDLVRLAEAYRTGDWSDPEEKQVTELALPGYVYYQSDYELEV